VPLAETVLHWYAVQTKSRQEKIVRDRLVSQGIEPLLPTVKKLSQWKDRKKEIEVPLFSGYCFVRFMAKEKLSIIKIPGVVGIVGGGKQPEPIPDDEIYALIKLMTTVFPYDPHPYLSEGMVVEVVRGRLEGVRGILLRKEKIHRLIIGVSLIQQAVAVEVNAEDVVAI